MCHSCSKAWPLAAAFICVAANAQTVIRDPVFQAGQRLEAERKAEAASQKAGQRIDAERQAADRQRSMAPGTGKSKGADAAPEGQRYALPAKAIDARNELLAKCLRVYTDNTTVHSHWFAFNLGKERTWHILGTPEGCKEYDAKVPSDARRDRKVVYTPSSLDAFAAEARYLGTAQHLGWDVTNPDGTALTEEDSKNIEANADDFSMQWVASRPFDALFPVRDDYTSRLFFGDARLSFLHSVQASGFTDRIAFNTELVSDRIGWGRLALIAAFAGTKPGEDAITDANRPKDNLQKFLTQGGDFGITFEMPLFYVETPLIPGFVVLEANPRFVTTIPGLSSRVDNVSGAFEPGARLHVRIRGWENTISPYGEVSAAWVMGMGADWQKYVNLRENFGLIVTNAGLTISDRYNIGASYILGGPLRGQNGVSISVSVLTGN